MDLFSPSAPMCNYDGTVRSITCTYMSHLIALFSNLGIYGKIPTQFLFMLPCQRLVWNQDETILGCFGFKFQKLDLDTAALFC